MRLVREHIINEKFTEDSDPIYDMGIGIYAKHNFDSIEQCCDFIIDILPTLLGTDSIPNDIIGERMYYVNTNYADKIYDYCLKYVYINNRSFEIYGDDYIHDIWVLLNEKLQKMGFETYKHSKINEKFTEDSDPISDMGIGKKRLIKDWFVKSLNTPERDFKQFIKINENLTIDILTDICFLRSPFKTKFPEFVQFENTQKFDISETYLITLKGCPKYVDGDFNCSNNLLTSLNYCPETVLGDFICSRNKEKFSKEDVEKRCFVKGRIIVE